MIIFGSRIRVSTLNEGLFYCPRCGGDRTYTTKSFRRWFTLFFVPVIPLGGVQGTRVVCGTCRGAFNEQVLSLPSGSAFDEIERRAFRQCAEAVLKSGNPGSPAARSSLIEAIRARGGSGGSFDDSALDQELGSVDPGDVAVFVGPVAPRLPAEKVERFFGECASIALADGSATPGQTSVLRNLGESFNLTEAHQRGIIEMLGATKQSPVGEPGH